MKLPFTIEQFFGVFRNYNQSVFPMQIVFYLLGSLAILLSIKKRVHADRIINAILSFFWLWMGIVYHIIYFAPINKAAYLFGGIELPTLTIALNQDTCAGCNNLLKY